MLTTLQIEQYMARLKIQNTGEPDLEFLRILHKAHMQQIPFENLDIALGIELQLDIPALFDKIISRKRGGFCYEMNHLFSALLAALGYEVKLLAAQVFNDGKPGPEFDHLLLQVNMGGQSLIADVGFGDSFITPLTLNGPAERQGQNHYQCRHNDDVYVLYQQKPGQDFMPQYQFDLIAYPISAFEPMCVYQQTSPLSSFTRKTVCTRATNSGRITLSNGRIIQTSNENKKKRSIQTKQDYLHILNTDFDVVLPEDISAESWARLLPEDR